jgi:hypothetical protein
MNTTAQTTTTAPADQAPYVGMPATINLFSDKMAAVVVKINKKSIVVQRVEIDPSATYRINAEAEPFPALATPGILDRPIGEPERYSKIEGHYGTRYANGSISVTLGRSISLTDYRY